VREIILSNIDVIRRILTPGKSISPQMITLPLPQKSDLAKVMYANAITLTPGTVSVQLDRDTIMVHALSKEAADALKTGDMASRVPDDKESSL
jgi:multicomponent Na+:H+ antiporter subunit E